MSQLWLYQLDKIGLEHILPTLLEKTLSRGWRAIVQSGSAERLQAIDNFLWTYRDDSFLPHGRDDGANQPVYLTLASDNPNDAEVRFLIDGAAYDDSYSYARIVCLIDGDDEEARAHGQAWRQWGEIRGLDVTYWRQNDRGSWSSE